MNEPGLVLFDDQVAKEWFPFALTRPVGELRYGAWTLRQRAERMLGAKCLGHVTHPALLPFEEPEAAKVLDPSAIQAERDLILLSSRAVLTAKPPDLGNKPAIIAINGRACGAFVPAGHAMPAAEFFQDPAGYDAPWPVLELEGECLQHVWELVTRGVQRLGRDLATVIYASHAMSVPQGVHVLGSEPLLLGQNVTIEPGVLIDLRSGPIRLDDGVTIRAFTRLAGPSIVGTGTTLLGGRFEGINAGPACKLHGEIEASTFLGHANKAHDGFLGHAYVGRWVNLGALTTNSDLKNNYGNIRMWTPEGMRDTGEMKLGCLLGDHVKTAIGMFLPTGMLAGAGSNIFGESAVPVYVPPFSWGVGEGAGDYEIDRFLATAETVMKRRNVELSQEQRSLLRMAWERRHNR